MRKVIEAFVLETDSNVYKNSPNGYRAVKQESGSIVLFNKDDKVVKTYQNKSELDSDEKSVVTHRRDLTPAMIAKAKRLHIWKSNPFDTKYGGSITDWDKFRSSK